MGGLMFNKCVSGRKVAKFNYNFLNNGEIGVGSMGTILAFSFWLNLTFFEYKNIDFIVIDI